MLEDRDYMRQPEYEDSRWRPRLRLRFSWTLALLCAYVVVFLAELAMAQFAPKNHLFAYLALSPEGLGSGYVWQLVTYQFMHAGFFHLLLNGLVILFLGRELEEMLGGKRFLALVFSSGIVGGVFQMLITVVWPHYFGGAVVGASACAFGLVAAYATMFPRRELTLLVFFVIPVHLQARTLLFVSAALALVGFGFQKFMPGVAHAAHLGGMVMGVAFVRWMQRTGRPLQGEVSMRVPERLPEEKSPSEFVQSEVDPILDKISQSGIESLTARERAVLETARRKMERR